jgi:4-alpha-glucanotransferase
MMTGMSELAAQWGIATEYFDAYGQRRAPDPAAMAKIIAAVSSDRPPPRRLLPSAIIFRRGRDAGLPLAPITGRWTVLSDGQEIAAGTTDSTPIQLPGDIPPGTYRFAIIATASEGELHDETVLLVAPERAFRGEEAPLWALAVQLYGVRSRRNWGHGDFTDLLGLVALAADLGAAAIGLNPLHALFDGQASPYSPNSRLFLNPLYIDVNAIPEFPGAHTAGLEQAVRRLRQHEQVDYAGVARVKLAGLRVAHKNFRRQGNARRRRDFEKFRSERGAPLSRFAAFEVLRRRFQQVWWDWPAEWRNADDAAVSRLRRTDAEAIEFIEFVQWIADRQLGACRDLAGRLGLPIGLYLDVAVGVQAGGADAWSEQDAILSSLSIGAPPDPLNSNGQNWGLAGFNPAGLHRRRFEPFRQMLGASMRHGGAVRLDHVLGLKRLFVVPHGMKPMDGTYVQMPFEPLLAVVAQESAARECIVIGEDLGTVPEGFRETLADWDIWSYRVMMFERAADGSFLLPEHYAPSALVTFNTHDLPTFAGWITGHDLATKRGLGLDPGETDSDRAQALAALRSALSASGPDDVGFAAVLKHLAATPSRLLIVSMEDALDLKDQPNVPGTVDEHPNWRLRLPVLLEDLAADERLRNVAKVLAAHGRGLRRRGEQVA